jgi:hypothetical protein
MIAKISPTKPRMSWATRNEAVANIRRRMFERYPGMESQLRTARTMLLNRVVAEENIEFLIELRDKLVLTSLDEIGCARARVKWFRGWNRRDTIELCFREFLGKPFITCLPDPVQGEKSEPKTFEEPQPDRSSWPEPRPAIQPPAPPPETREVTIEIKLRNDFDHLEADEMTRTFSIVFYEEWESGRQFRLDGRMLSEADIYQALLDLVIHKEETQKELTTNALRSLQSFGFGQISRSRGELLKIDSPLLRKYGFGIFIDLFGKPWFEFLDTLRSGK